MEELDESEYETFGDDITGLKNKVKGSDDDKDVSCLIKAGGEENTMNSNKKKIKKKMKKKTKGGAVVKDVSCLIKDGEEENTVSNINDKKRIKNKKKKMKKKLKGQEIAGKVENEELELENAEENDKGSFFNQYLFRVWFFNIFVTIN